MDDLRSSVADSHSGVDSAAAFQDVPWPWWLFFTINVNNLTAVGTLTFPKVVP